MIDLKYTTQNRKVFFEIAKKHIITDSKVLDIGAGDGSFADYCEHKSIYLYDGNEESVNTLKEKYNNVFLGNLPKLPFENEYFNVIHCSHVIEHLEPQVFYDSLKEMDRCLKPGGVLIISTPLLWDSFYDDLSHIKPYSPYVLIKYLTDTGNNNLTRTKISTKYENIELIYRYYEKFYTEDLVSTKNNIASFFIKKFINLSYRAGLRKYEKNGYTIVLKKTS